MNNRGGTRLVNAVKKCHPSVFATLASAGERRLKRPAYAVAKGVQRPPSSARPLETKRLQRLSRKSRSHRSKRDRRTLSFLRAAPATAEHHPRALARALISASRRALGPASAFFPAARPTGLQSGRSAGRGRAQCRASGPGTTPAPVPDSDSGSGSESEQEKKVQTNRWAAVSDSDSSDEGERVVRSAKDKAWDGMKAVVSGNARKINDWHEMQTPVGNQPASGARLSHFSAMTRPTCLGRAVTNQHRHAIEQASRRWRGGRNSGTRRKLLISTQADPIRPAEQASGQS